MPVWAVSLLWLVKREIAATADDNVGSAVLTNNTICKSLWWQAPHTSEACLKMIAVLSAVALPHSHVLGCVSVARVCSVAW